MGMKRIFILALFVYLMPLTSFSQVAGTWTAENIVIDKVNSIQGNVLQVCFTATIKRNGNALPQGSLNPYHNCVLPGQVNADITQHLAVFYNVDLFDPTSIPSTITYVPPAATVKTAQDTFLNDLRVYQGMLVAIKFGARASNDPAVETQRLLVVSEYLPAYDALIGGFDLQK
jgi:hypothetical protein